MQCQIFSFFLCISGNKNDQDSAEIYKHVLANTIVMKLLIMGNYVHKCHSLFVNNFSPLYHLQALCTLWDFYNRNYP